jgi:hypothetical protein
MLEQLYGLERKMYGTSFDFSGVTLPGVGGSINASNAISGDQLEAMNKSGKKWRPGLDGMMSNHNEEIIKTNAASRAKKESLVNREYNEQANGKDAMKEILSKLDIKKTQKNEYVVLANDILDLSTKNTANLSHVFHLGLIRDNILPLSSSFQTALVIFN